MASFEDNRDTLAAELFARTPTSSSTSITTNRKEGLRQKFIKLERLTKQELARWWDATTLKRYIELKQVPRGLRVIIFPSFDDLDPDLLGEWEHLISSTSFGMMNILIKHAERKREKLLLEISSLEDQIKSLDLPEATAKNYSILRDTLNDYQLYIKDKKLKKIIRDENDYANGRIYTFARRFDQVNKDRTDKGSNTNLSDVSIPSSSISDTSNVSGSSSDPATGGSVVNVSTSNVSKPSPFLEELGRYRIGIRQNFNRNQNANPPVGGGRNMVGDIREGVTTRSTAKTKKT
ncbi:hypothetical protein NDU88_002898 [Pleurodeles waltl]|uniref:Uncharacterized protein n=1 Tax=Pleurodeles waltl TaxID=8319 RepID=A0AAV7KV08_PLEWA|nr:hypothetical protein NDU88_002898 [Pleurodeles waltl]